MSHLMSAIDRVADRRRQELMREGMSEHDANEQAYEELRREIKGMPSNDPLFRLSPDGGK